MSNQRLHRAVDGLLQETGLPYEIRPGKRHFKVVLAGRVVSILPMGNRREQGRAWDNFAASIRRAAREARAQ